MLVSDVINRVRIIAGDTNVLQYTDQNILDWINDGVRECALNNNLLQKRATQDTVIGQAGYSLPTDILKLHSVTYNDTKLPVLTLEEFDQQYENSDMTGTPQTSYLWAGQITLYPTPAEVKTLTINYIYDPATTSLETIGTTEVPLPVGYHQRIIDYCLAQIAQLDDDLQKYSMKMEEFRTGVQNLKDQPEWEYDLYPFMSTDMRDMGDSGGYFGW